MKKLYLLLITLCASFSAFSQVDSVIVFRPGPGVNDSTDQGGLNGGKDAFAVEDPPTNNYADHPAVYATPVSNCNQTHVISFIQFDLTTLPDTVDSVFVVFTHMAQTNYCYSNCVADFYFAAVTQPWYEQTLNYSNQPAHDTAFYGPIPLSFPDTAQVRRFNITNMYNLWKQGTVPNNGFAVYSPTIGCNNAAISFYAYSSDDTANSNLNRPYLEVHFTVDTGVALNLEESLAAQLKLKAYPNPANGELNISFTTRAASEVSYMITDMMGRVLLEEKMEAVPGKQNIKLPLNGLTPGMYCYRLSTKEGTVIDKFIKQ